MSELDVHALLADASLLAISTVALSANRKEREDKTDGELTVEPQYTLETGWRSDEIGFRIALQTEIEAPVGDIRCDVQAEYELQQYKMSDISQAVLQEFVNQVALMAILPFVRQGIADITLRVFEAPLLMPIIQRGEITFNLAGDNLTKS